VLGKKKKELAMNIAVGDVIRAAQSLHDAGEAVTYPAIAASLNATARQVHGLAERVLGLRARIRPLLSKGCRPLTHYLSAARSITLRGEFVTNASLASELGLTAYAVKCQLARRHEWKTLIRPLSRFEERRARRFRAYSDAIVANRRIICVPALQKLSEVSGIGASQVAKDIMYAKDRGRF
jgi:hypothetical protein